MTSPKSYIIVGAGVFGTSTALHLKTKYPEVSVTLVDRNAYTAPTRVAASWDWNKVVRADYHDIAYTRLALEAQRVWRSGDALWTPFYHESGIYWISSAPFGQRVVGNFAELGEKADLEARLVGEARGMYRGLFEGAQYAGAEEVLVNRSSGWADAKDVLQKVIEHVVGMGVRYVEAEVGGLVFEDGERGGCRGVRTREGEVIEAEKVILSTGAFTPRLLVDSAPGRTDLHAGERIVAAGVTEAIAPLNAEQMKTFGDMPVAINELPAERWASNGCLPPNRDNHLKYWGQTIFSNTLSHPVTGQTLSMPPREDDYAQWNVPPLLKEDVRLAQKFIFGQKAEGIELDKFRICWDAFTPSQDFIISPHSACDNLYIATCGSFHGWKFFPIIGKYVVDMLDGVLDPSLQKKWAWDRELPPASERPADWPRKELKDLFPV